MKQEHLVTGAPILTTWPARVSVPVLQTSTWQMSFSKPTCSMRLLKRALSCLPRQTDWKATAALRTRR
jgi:hypothetical protein